MSVNIKPGKNVLTGVDTLKVQSADSGGGYHSFTLPKTEETKSVTITANGTSTVIPTDANHVMTSVSVTVAIPEYDGTVQ